MFVTPDNDKLVYMGRIDFSNKTVPRFFYAGSQILFKFKGTGFSVKINNRSTWGTLSLGAVIDGKMYSGLISSENDGKDVFVEITKDLPNTAHDVVIYKKFAANHAFSFLGIELDGELLEKPELPELKIEVYGDSVCAGEVIEALDYVGKCDPEDHRSVYDNAWHSFVMQTARNLNAQIHNIAQGGIAFIEGTGYFHAPDYIGMENVYDKLCYFPEGGDITEWDFSRYIPDIVIVELGQNDAHDGVNNCDINIYDAEYREKWKSVYKNMLRILNKKYGSPKFVLTTTVLMHDKEWDNAIEEIKNELCAEGMKVYHNIFSRNGAATPGHPRLPEHDEMAEELTAFIKNILA